MHTNNQVSNKQATSNIEARNLSITHANKQQSFLCNYTQTNKKANKQTVMYTNCQINNKVNTNKQTNRKQTKNKYKSTD